jgi:hypothetical protein
MKLIITESQRNESLKRMVTTHGFEVVAKMVGVNYLINDVFNGDPYEYLSLFNNLIHFESEQNPGIFIYKFESGDNVFVVDSRDSEVNYVYLNYNIFFSPLLNFSARLLQTVINWLRDNYDIISKIHNVKFFKPNGGDDDYGFMAELT